MALATKWFGTPLMNTFGATATDQIDYVNDTIKIALTTITFTPAQDTHDYFADVTNELVATGYTAGGATIGGKTLTYDAATNTVRLKGTISNWSITGGATWAWGIIYKDTTVAGTSPLLGYINFGGSQTVTDGSIALTQDATDGWLRLVAS